MSANLRNLIVIFGLLTIGSLAVAAEEITPVDLDGDISGQYKFTLTNQKDGKVSPFTFFIVKTPFQVNDRDGKKVNFYTASKALGDHFRYSLFGFYVDSDKEAPGKFRIVWWLVSKGKPIDGESSMLLQQQGNTLSFGGDYEKYEIFRLEKISDKQF